MLAEGTLYRDRPEDRRPAPSLFTSPGWIAAIEATYGVDFHCTGAAGGAQVVCLFDDALGPRMVAPAYGDYAERCPAEGLAGRIASVRDAFPAHPLAVKVAGEATIDAPISRDALLHEVPLGEGDGEPKTAFLRLARQAERAGLTVTARTDAAAVEDFYALYAAQRLTRFGLLPQPVAFFRHVAGNFFGSGEGALWEARADGRPAAYLFILTVDDVAYYKFGCADPDALGLRPNNLLFRHVLDRAREEGRMRLDLGLTPSGNEGLARFKRSMGAREMTLRTFSLPPLDGAAPDTGSRRALLGEITRTVVEGEPSVEAASACGAALYRYFA
ncbi:GNAT family N-acetyltransferase [Acuticoccus sp.]|uniref:GNAT family N-acetyltransferase n=1 Tax=Acuticoccus sp. TaxID=1904378 RepID=UPI003B51BE1D